MPRVGGDILHIVLEAHSKHAAPPKSNRANPALFRLLYDLRMSTGQQPDNPNRRLTAEPSPVGVQRPRSFVLGE